MEKTAAVVTIRDASEMTRRGRKDVASWLRRTADALESSESKEWASRFTARYLYK